MHEVVKKITRNSREIAGIIDTVNVIAYRTDCFALSAALEGGHNGGQERDFNVVATKVRHLTGRAAESARKIEKRIETNIARENKDDAFRNDEDNNLQEIAVGTERADHVIKEIVAVLQQLTMAMKDIHAAIEELNRVVPKWVGHPS